MPEPKTPSEQIFAAAASGDVAEIKRLCAEHGPGLVHSRNALGDTPLMTAAWLERPASILTLVGFGADPQALNGQSETALHKASAVQTIKTLLDLGADPKAVGAAGRTTLMACAVAGNPEALQLLAKAGAAPEARCALGKTALHYAFQNRAPIRNMTPAVSALLAIGCPSDIPDSKGVTPLSLAAQTGRSAAAALLLEAGAAPNRRDASGMTPLMHGASHRTPATAGHLCSDMVRSPNAGVNERNKLGETALEMACRAGNFTAGKAIAGAGGRVSSDDPALLVECVQSGTLQTVQAMLAGMADPDSCDDRGTPALVAAARRTIGEKFAFALLDAGGDADVADARTGETALHVTTSAALAERLAESANVNSRDRSGRTPLRNAAEKGRDDIVSILLTQGADASIRANDGLTAGDAAAAGRHKECSFLLGQPLSGKATEPLRRRKSDFFETPSIHVSC